MRMDSGRSYNGTYGKDGALQDWQRNAERTLERTVDPMQRARPAMQSTIRAVTPEPVDNGGNDSYGTGSSIHTSPRSIPGGEKPRDRRQGLVFEDSYSTDSLEGPPTRSGPPVSFHSRPRSKFYFALDLATS
jgi:hypothetical protein